VTRERRPRSGEDRFFSWQNLLGWGEGSESLAPYVPTPLNVVREMLKLVEAGPGDTLYDLGCGDGRILLTAVEEFGVDRAVGYELKKNLVEAALRNVRERGYQDRIQVHFGNLMEADLREASIVTLYLTTTGNAKLQPKLREELRAGARVVSHDFPMADWTPVTGKEAYRVGTHKVYVYKIPGAYAV